MLEDMADLEAFKALHLALEGALDQITRAQRLATEASRLPEGLAERIDGAFATVAALRNEARDGLMSALARAPAAPTIRIGKHKPD